MTRLRADALLVFAALIWGTAFVAQKQGNTTMGPVLFVGLRFLLTAVLTAPLAWTEARRAGAAKLSRSDWRLAAGIGAMLAVGAALQQVGLVSTSATHGGFLTALYLVMVPFVGRLVVGTPLRFPILAACVVSVAGAALLGDLDLRSWDRGDLIILVADVAWALQITGVSRFLRRVDRPFLLAWTQALVTGVAGTVVGLAIEPTTLDGVRAALPSLIYAGAISGGVAFTIQVVAQKHTPPAEAALIMSLESVFAALSGAALLQERLTAPATVGCALILAGALAVELWPVWAERKSA